MLMMLIRDAGGVRHNRGWRSWSIGHQALAGVGSGTFAPCSPKQPCSMHEHEPHFPSRGGAPPQTSAESAPEQRPCVANEVGPQSGTLAPRHKTAGQIESTFFFFLFRMIQLSQLRRPRKTASMAPLVEIGELPGSDDNRLSDDQVDTILREAEKRLSSQNPSSQNPTPTLALAQPTLSSDGGLSQQKLPEPTAKLAVRSPLQKQAEVKVSYFIIGAIRTHCQVMRRRRFAA